MKKLIVFFLALFCVLGTVGCSEKVTHDPAPQTEQNHITANPEDNEPLADTPVNGDDALKAELFEKYGTPFCLRRAEGMGMWMFTLTETTAKREYHHSIEGSFHQEALSWKIENGELIITGEWNESFSLDMAAGEASSKTDGAVYRIIQNPQ